jgi:hypothetical protein
MISLDLYEDLHGSGAEQVAVPAPGDPVTVQAMGAVTGGASLLSHKGTMKREEQS